MSTLALNPDMTLDCSGLNCPMPVIKTSKAIKQIDLGRGRVQGLRDHHIQCLSELFLTAGIEICPDAVELLAEILPNPYDKGL